MKRTKKLVSGDRNWSNIDVIADEMIAWPSDAIVVHGAAAGVDTIADLIAEQLGMERRPYPYIRDLGKRGGPARNRQMVAEEHVQGDEVDEIVAFHDDIIGSRGTLDMLFVGRENLIPCRLITSAGEVSIPWTEMESARSQRRKRK